HFVQAPGRVELLGNHTDYNEGLVMSLAVDRYIFIASAPRSDGRIALVSSAFPGKEEFSLSRIEKNPAAPWADYLKGVLLQLRAHGVCFTGFNAAIHSTLPIGAGLSSSGALEVATALTVRKLHPYKLTDSGTAPPPRRDAKGELPPLTAKEKLAISKLCQAAESQFAGVNCGVLDYVSSLFGKEQHVIEIDCQQLTVELEPMVGDVAIIILNSGVKHELAAGEYNELRRHCESAAWTIGVKSLRAVDVQRLAANGARLSERDYQCAYHIVGENQRVIFGGRALRAGDLEQFGQYLYQSHESSRDFFKNSCPELDLLVELARPQPGCLGARLTGGGCGGATINLVETSHAKQFMEAMTAQYRKRSGHTVTPLQCRIVDGAR
ncbi:MAG: galactokinase, partial [Pedosphaera parvula]|nr:galactokinase [Pedosphaera parvula]